MGYLGLLSNVVYKRAINQHLKEEIFRGIKIRIFIIISWLELWVFLLVVGATSCQSIGAGWASSSSHYSYSSSLFSYFSTTSCSSLFYYLAVVF